MTAPAAVFIAIGLYFCYTDPQEVKSMNCDCHMHMVLDGCEWKSAMGRHKEAPDDGFIRRVLAGYQADGYTYLRDGGDRLGAGKRARALAPEYGICYRTPLAPISCRGHYGGFIGVQFDTVKEYAGLVKKARAEGADFLKLMISGLMDFDRFGVLTEPGLAPDLIRQMVHIAKEEGFSVMAHANGARTVEAAAEAGVHSVEHGAYLDGQALAAMAEMGTVWVPTLSTIGNLRGKGRFNEEAVEKIYASAGENLRQFAAMGGGIACGSDAGAWAVPHGGNTELAHLRQALGPDADRIVEQGNRKIQALF